MKQLEVLISPAVNLMVPNALIWVHPFQQVPPKIWLDGTDFQFSYQEGAHSFPESEYISERDQHCINNMTILGQQKMAVMYAVFTCDHNE